MKVDRADEGPDRALTLAYRAAMVNDRALVVRNRADLENV